MTPLFKTIPVVVTALVLGGWAIWWGAGLVFVGYVSSTWPHTTCIIQESRIDSSHVSKGTSYSPVINYTYTVDGHTYQGSRINSRGHWDYAASRQVVDAYPVGSQRPVYYSPSAPASSILITGVYRSSFVGLVLGTLILSVGTLFGTIGYLAPKYGHTVSGRTYTFDDDSPVALIAPLGMIAIMCQFGLLIWLVRWS